MAADDGIAVAEARQRYDYFVLATDFTATVLDDHIAMYTTYGAHDERASSRFQRVWPWLRMLEARWGYCVYDPQLDRILDLSEDCEAAIARYDGVDPLRGAIRAIARGQIMVHSPARQPWWKFW